MWEITKNCQPLKYLHHQRYYWNEHGWINSQSWFKNGKTDILSSFAWSLKQRPEHVTFPITSTLMTLEAAATTAKDPVRLMGVCLLLCSSACQLFGRESHKFQIDFHEIFTTAGTQSNIDLIKFWCWYGSESRNYLFSPGGEVQAQTACVYYVQIIGMKPFCTA